MRKFASILLIISMLVVFTGCYEGDPFPEGWYEDVYTEDLTVSNDADIAGDLTVDGDLYVGGTLEVVGPSLSTRHKYCARRVSIPKRR